MSVEVVGDCTYELIYKDDPPLTVTQAEVLIAEYAKLGLRYQKCKWRGKNCLIVKVPTSHYKQFSQKLSIRWQIIRERVGYEGALKSINNTFQAGETTFIPDENFGEVAALIESTYTCDPDVHGDATSGKAVSRSAVASGCIAAIMVTISLLVVVWWRPFGHHGLGHKMLFSVGALVGAWFAAIVVETIVDKLTRAPMTRDARDLSSGAQ